MSSSVFLHFILFIDSEFIKTANAAANMYNTVVPIKFYLKLNYNILQAYYCYLHFQVYLMVISSFENL